jgi:hypothetical protein
MNLLEIASASALIKQELTPLAEKLGQGAEYTFGLFVRQVYVNAFTDLLWFGIGIPLLFAGRYLLKRTQDKEIYDNSPYYIFGVIALLIAFILIALPLSGLINALINPQYQAIKLILETIK